MYDNNTNRGEIILTGNVMNIDFVQMCYYTMNQDVRKSDRGKPEKTKGW